MNLESSVPPRELLNFQEFNLFQGNRSQSFCLHYKILVKTSLIKLSANECFLLMPEPRYRECMAFMELRVTAKSSDSRMLISLLILLKPDDLLSPCYAH